jgi:hypothetical protein
MQELNNLNNLNNLDNLNNLNNLNDSNSLNNLDDSSSLNNLNSKFHFGSKSKSKRIVYLHVHKSYSNFFMTLTDCRARVITCITAAKILGKLERRRRRKAPQTIENMIAGLDKYFTLYNI